MDNKWVWFVSFCLPRGPEFCQDVFCFASVCGSISWPFLVVKSLWSFMLLYNSLVHDLFCLECACVVPRLSLRFSIQFSGPLCSKWWQGAALYPHTWLCFFFPEARDTWFWMGLIAMYLLMWLANGGRSSFWPYFEISFLIFFEYLNWFWMETFSTRLVVCLFSVGLLMQLCKFSCHLIF